MSHYCSIIALVDVVAPCMYLSNIIFHCLLLLLIFVCKNVVMVNGNFLVSTLVLICGMPNLSEITVNGFSIHQFK